MIFNLLCYTRGDDSKRAFPVEIKGEESVGTLKKVIKAEKTPTFDHIPADALLLWKASVPFTKNLKQVIDALNLVDDDALEPPDILSDVFPSGLEKRTVHIVVDAPPLKRACLSMIPAPSNASPRRDTVIALYKRLKEYSFVLVRGTPASGKTVLAQLLAEYISQQDPNVRIIWLYGWSMKDVKESGNYRSFLMQKGWVVGEKTIFIFDEAQLSYEDGELWGEFFKSMHEERARQAIAFASYGSPTSRISIVGTSFFIPDKMRVTLRHIDHGDDLPPTGLLFTRSEFNDLIMRHYPSPQFCFHPSFYDALFDITNGHVGAIRDFIAIITTENSYRKIKHTTDQLFTWDIFLAEVDPRDLLQKLASASVFGRGLPEDTDLQSPTTACIFSAVLSRNFVTDADFTTDDEKNALQMCFRRGWLHADNLGVLNLPQSIGYVFPSSLHRWYVEWKLSDGFPPTKFEPNRLLDFVIDAIHLFSPRLLSPERRIGPGSIQRRPEAQYQDEMYRCCHTLSKGSLVTFPEFGTAKGRVDFCIPAKGWGIELLREGNQLASHCSRFSDTGSYRTTLSLSEYIVIDCRTTSPKYEHPEMSNLYHVVFKEDFHNVCILDNRLRPVDSGEFRLLESS